MCGIGARANPRADPRARATRPRIHLELLLTVLQVWLRGLNHHGGLNCVSPVSPLHFRVAPSDGAAVAAAVVAEGWYVCAVVSRRASCGACRFAVVIALLSVEHRKVGQLNGVPPNDSFFAEK